MLEPKTVEFLQELKAAKKIKSVSGLVEIALEEFFNKYVFLLAIGQKGRFPYYSGELSMEVKSR